jgi:hypothetical protein
MDHSLDEFDCTNQSLQFVARKASCASLAMELVANALVYVGGYLFLVFMAVCLATGA